jgi:hypothetical protein
VSPEHAEARRQLAADKAQAVLLERALATTYAQRNDAQAALLKAALR